METGEIPDKDFVHLVNSVPDDVGWNSPLNLLILLLRYRADCKWKNYVRLWSDIDSGRVVLPNAPDRKYPNAGQEWGYGDGFFRRRDTTLTA